MTPTELEKKFRDYLQDLDRNYFICGKTKTECNHKSHIINIIRKAFFAGYYCKVWEDE